MIKPLLQSSRIACNFVSNSKFEDSFPYAFNEVFDNRTVNHHQEPKDENISHYYINTQTKETTNEKEKNDNIKIIIQRFIIKKEEPIKFLGLKKNRGRRKKKEVIENNQNSNENSQKKHDKNSLDNIMNKVQIDSINCLIKCINSIKYSYDKNEKEKFLDINSDFKKNVKKGNIVEIKKKELHEILTQNISKKFKNFPKDYNKKLYEKMEKEVKYKSIINFLNLEYLTFFQNIYYKKERTVNLHQYGIEKTISLSKKLGIHYEKNQSFIDEDVEYQKSIQKYINENYFDGKLIFQLEESG